MLRKKTCGKRVFFALIGKAIENNFTKIYEMLEFGLSLFFQMSVSGERDHWKEHPSTLKLES